MEITPFRQEYLQEAAALFAGEYRQLRGRLPILPPEMEDTDRVVEKLQWLFGFCPGVAAVEGGRLIGYMGWFLSDNFRRTERKGAYCPEWGHAAAEGRKAAIYWAMYRAASKQWSEAGCHVHAITLLAHDAEAERAWFWSGFGLLVVDAMRPMTAVEGMLFRPSNLRLRKATLADLASLTVLDAEHCRHYTQPPVFMALPEAGQAEEFAAFLSMPKNSIWLALDGETPVGFIRCDGYDFDGVEIVRSDRTVAITGAYVRPDYRGQQVALRLLDAALRDYAAQGMGRCALNFESFNPEAASFWPRFFEPVCHSLMRIPETPISTA